MRYLASNHLYFTMFKHVEICASNELPHRSYLSDCPSFFIVNTDPNFETGSHWICIYVYRVNNIIQTYFYDPLGLSSSDYNKHIGRFIQYTTDNAGICYINQNIHQSENSILCGYYCLSFFFSLITLSSEPNEISSMMVSLTEEDIVKKTLLGSNLISWLNVIIPQNGWNNFS